MSTDNAVIVFVKAPEKGRVKTRLAKGVGDAAALALYRCFVMDVLDMVRSTPWDLRVYYYPENAYEPVRTWLGDNVDLFPKRAPLWEKKWKMPLPRPLPPVMKGRSSSGLICRICRPE